MQVLKSIQFWILAIALVCVTTLASGQTATPIKDWIIMTPGSGIVNVDLTVNAGVPFMWGQKFYVGAYSMPEFRLRAFSDEGWMSFFGSVGYTGVKALFNAPSASDASHLTATPFGEAPVYLDVGLLLNITKQTGTQLTSGISTGITNIVFGLGYMNAQVGSNLNDEPVYDGGFFFTVGVSTSVLSFSFG